MKTLALLALASATLAYGRDDPSYLPTQSELEAALAQAAVAWGPTPAYVAGIATGDLGDCILNAAWADLAARTITLNLNPTCHWTRELVRIAVLHEYGHPVLNTSAHSLDRRSVMFRALALRESKSLRAKSKEKESREIIYIISLDSFRVIIYY